MPPLKLRVHCAHVVKDQDQLLFEKQPLSGFAYQFDANGQLEAVLDVEAGKVIGHSQDLLFSEKQLVRVDYDVLTEELENLELYLFQGQEFTGMWYMFSENGRLIQENDYTFGNLSGIYREWHPSGQIRCDGTNKKLKTEWHENGQISSYTYYNKKFISYKSISFDNDGAMKRLSCTSEAAIDFTDLQFYAFSTEFYFSLGGITDDVIQTLLTPENLIKLKILFLQFTSVTATTLGDLNFGHLKELHLIENNFILSDSARRIKKKHPNCTVYYHSSKIEIENRLRVDLDRIKTDHDILYYHDKLLIGFVYQFAGDGSLARVMEVKDGRVVNADVHHAQDGPMLQVSHLTKRIKYDALQPCLDYIKINQERYLIEAKEFHGVAYSFDDNGLLREESYFNPEKSCYRQWYPSGQIKMDYQHAQDWRSWYENGQIQQRQAASEVTKYNDNGTIYCYFLEDEVERSFSAEIGKKFVFCGQGINDDMLRQLFEVRNRAWLKDLSLRQSSVTLDALDKNDLSQLTSLSLLGNDYLSLEAAKYLKTKHPQCTVRYNDLVLD